MEGYKITDYRIYPGSIEVVGENDGLLDSVRRICFAVGGDDLDCYYDVQLFDDNGDPILTKGAARELEERAYSEAIKDFTEELLNNGFIIDDETDFGSALQYKNFCVAVREFFNLPYNHNTEEK